MVCNDVENEPVFQELTGQSLPSGAKSSPDARLDIPPEVFGKGKDQRPSMYGYVTPTLINRDLDRSAVARVI